MATGTYQIAKEYSIPDSGWQSATDSTKFTGTIHYRKIGSFVEVYGNSIALKGSVGSSGYTLFSLPSGYRPSENRATPAGGTAKWGFLLFNSGGSVVFYKSSADSSWTGGNLNFSITFMLG